MNQITVEMEPWIYIASMQSTNAFLIWKAKQIDVQLKSLYIVIDKKIQL